MHSKEDVTRLLQDLSAGKTEAEAKLLPLVYEELRSLAGLYMRNERPSHTLQATALVHEAYLRLSNGKEMDWESRAQFLGIAARTMRRILIDYARMRNREKREGGWKRETLGQAEVFAGEPSMDLVYLNQALDQLAALDPVMVDVVELKFFAGLSVEETAKVLSVSPSTVKNNWRMAKAWLRQHMNPND